MKHIALTAILAPFALAACGGGGGGTSSDPFFVGTKSGSVAASGLPFADALSTVADTEGETITVQVVRFVEDWDSGTIRREITEETLTFVGGSAPSSWGGENWRARDALGSISATNVLAGSVYIYEGPEPLFDGEIDSQAFFVVGLETDPATVDATSGIFTYSGTADAYSGILDNDGEVSTSSGFWFGDVNLIANLNTSRMSGDLSNTFYHNGADVTVTFDDAPIVGNGFTGDLTASCSGDFTCTGSGTIGGAFFGDSGDEVAGVFGFDFSATDTVTCENSYEAKVAGAFVTVEDIP